MRHRVNYRETVPLAFNTRYFFAWQDDALLECFIARADHDQATFARDSLRMKKLTQNAFIAVPAFNSRQPGCEGQFRSNARATARATAFCLLAALAVCSGSATAAKSSSALPDWSGAWSFEARPAQGPPPAVIGALPPGIPLTPKYEASRAEAEAQYGHGGGRMAKCLPAGMPGVMVHGMAFEFVVTPARVTMIFQDGEVRRIFTDGSKHPPRNELYQNIQGHSIGHWEGSTLVVDTIGMTSHAELFHTLGLTVTPQTHIIERMHRKDANTFQIDTTVIDPAIFTKPYVYSRLFGDARLGDFEVSCTEHMRDTEDDIDLTPPVIEETP